MAGYGSAKQMNVIGGLINSETVPGCPCWCFQRAGELSRRRERVCNKEGLAAPTSAREAPHRA